MTYSIDLDECGLAEAMAVGDPTALDSLYTLYGSLALGLAMRMLGDRRTAEEVVQDAFLQVWRRAADFTPERASLRTWLLSIVRYRCIDLLRHRSARPHTVAWQPFHPQADDALDPAQEVERRQVGAVLRGAVRGLPAKQCEVLELAFFHERTHAEIADQLGIPLGTVKGRIRLGLARLRDSLAEDLSLHAPITHAST